MCEIWSKSMELLERNLKGKEKVGTVVADGGENPIL